MPAVLISGLTKRFGFFSVLKGVDLVLEQGEFLAIFGPNGAGKTTLLKILSTLSTPTSGHIRVFGYDLVHDGKHVRQFIGVLSHQPFLVPTLTGYENLKFYGQMFGVNNLHTRIEKLLKDVDMFERRNQLVETCSRGMQQRLGIARALLHHPRLLLLDEPYTGLDLAGIAFLQQTLKHFHDQGNTIIMTCHDFVRGLEFCTKAAILKQGALGYYSDPSQETQRFDVLYRQYVERQGEVQEGFTSDIKDEHSESTTHPQSCLHLSQSFQERDR